MPKSRFFLLAIGLVGIAHIPAGQGQELPEAAPLDGEYMVYGGGLGDHYSPTVGDTKLLLIIRGEAAREIFEQLGPETEQSVCYDPDAILRWREDVACQPDAEGYSCTVGFDLTTGKSIHSWIC
ncbi:MAG: hypothetical protein RJB62_832 [Pseudomonadota bacterium]|jgi:hypothetical protein